jgi:nucleoside-diphosphate-sugar epimerase
MSAKSVVITGANGFIGRHLCRMLIDKGVRVRACIRDQVSPSVFGNLADSLEICRLANLNGIEDEFRSFAGADVVVHLAGRAHVMRETQKDPLHEFRKVNVDGTRSMVNAALRWGVRRFLYVSSVKVNGEETKEGAFTADDPPGFVDPYGQSKWEAEESLKEIANGSTLEWVIVRPPLVYGPGVRGNFLSLLNLAYRGIPLPLGSVCNRRSLVSVYNLCDLLCVLLDHPAAANQCFLVGDAEDLSTPDLIRAVGEALGRPARMVSFPPSLLLKLSRLLGKEMVMQRLCSSLIVDRQKTSALLNWRAPLSFDDGVHRTAEWFLEFRKQK